MNFSRITGPAEDIQIWNSSSHGFSFVISHESRTGPGLHGRRTGFMISWRPLYQNRCAIKVAGSPFRTLTEAEKACETMLGYLMRSSAADDVSPRCLLARSAGTAIPCRPAMPRSNMKAWI